MEQPEAKAIEVGTWVYFKGGQLIAHLVVDELTSRDWFGDRRFTLVRITPYMTTVVRNVTYELLELYPSHLRTDI